MERFLEKAVAVRPTDRQLQWQKLEFYSFIHFSMNTFTGREWGDGKENPSIFNPLSLNTDQWVRTLKSAGMRGVVFTAKHHDGFCLWPSSHTEHSVKNSLWKNGTGDILRELSESCMKEKFKLGIYLSPWDRHDERYGSDEYNEYFKAQLRELLTAYGEIFEVWFDGACGEGKNGIKQIYDWQGYFDLIRELQPDALISNMGPDARWCGNEAGYCRPSEWSVVPSSLFNAESIAAKSQQEDDCNFITTCNAEDDDLGSRDKIREAEKLMWYPSEVNTSTRPGWFYHKSQDKKVKSLNELFNLYCSSVGGNNTLLLNVPPDSRGLIADVDVQRLKELGQCIDELNQSNLSINGSISIDKGIDGSLLIDEKSGSFLKLKNIKSVLTLNLEEQKRVNWLVLQEYIENGQKIEAFEIDIYSRNGWETVYSGTTVGYKKMCRFKAVNTDRIRLRITEARDKPELRSLRASYFDRVGEPDLKNRIKMVITRFGDKIYSFYLTRIK